MIRVWYNQIQIPVINITLFSTDLSVINMSFVTMICVPALDSILLMYHGASVSAYCFAKMVVVLLFTRFIHLKSIQFGTFGNSKHAIDHALSSMQF